jgi:8-oxo-dGTP diphosphatase
VKINEKWHRENKMPKNASDKERLQWHVDHARVCGCRPIPESVQKLMLQRKPKIVVGVLAKNKNRYLLVKEKLEGGKEWWIVPGGKVEFGETIEDAARRELLEETGIKAKNLEFLCFREALFPEYNYHTVIFFYLVKTNKIKIEDDIEGKVIEARWLTKKELQKLPLVDSALWLFEWLAKKQKLRGR